jgi:predicted amidohydrolase YtcJ
MIAYGSDWSVSSPDPLAGNHVAVTRRDVDTPSEAFLPDQASRLDTAIAAYTIGAAFALGLDEDTGSIEVGKLADLVVLSDDLFALPPERIATARVLLTLLDGETAYRDPGFGAGEPAGAARKP